MDTRASQRSGPSRRFLIPLVFVGLLAIPALRACSADPSVVAEPPTSPSAAAAAASAPAAQARAKLPERAVSRAGEACQEWKIGSPPRRVACPKILDDGEIIVFERDATCTRKGGTRTQAPVPCPMAAELDGPLAPLPSTLTAAVPDRPPAPKP